MSKTVVQKLISYYEGLVKECDEVPPLLRNNAAILRGAYKNVVSRLESLLPEEKKQIRNAWIDGYSNLNQNDKAGADFETYYSTTYTDTTKTQSK